MGWASATDIFDEIIKAAMEAIPDDAVRSTFYERVLEAFEQHDWDTQNEAMGIDWVFDDVLLAKHPDWEDEDF